jgi:hypothetical protein
MDDIRAKNLKNNISKTKNKDAPRFLFWVFWIFIFGILFIFIFPLIIGKPAFYLLNKMESLSIKKSEVIDLSKNKIKFNNEEYKLPENINPQGLNLIFLADQYSSWEEFEGDINGVMGELRNIEPWKSYQNFNIYKINPKEMGLCYIKTKDERKPVLRCRTDINNYLNNLPLDKFRLIVLSRQEFQSWANLTRYENSGIFFSIPKALTDPNEQRVNALLLAHLLGHTFGLKDEEIFVIAKAFGAPHTPDGPNCAPDATTAEKWWGDLAKKDKMVGYFKGCAGDETFIKPTVSSIMNLNTGAPIVYTYGPVSEDYLKKVLNYCFSANNQNEASLDKEFFKKYPDFKGCIK